MTALSLIVEVGFGSTWRTEDASITWTDITCYVNDGVQPISCRRGATSAHGTAGTGTGSLSINNADRRFDSLNAAGPYFGDLVPGVPIRLLGQTFDVLTDELGDPILDELGDPFTAVTSIEVARGFVKSWPQHSDGPTMSRVPVQFLDGFHNLSRAPLISSVYDWEVAKDSPKAYWKLTDPAGATQASDSSGNGYDGTYRNDPDAGGEPLVFGSVGSREFNGSNQAVDVSDPAVRIDTGTDEDGFTVEVWFKSTSSPSASEYDTLFNQSGDAGQSTIRVTIDDSGSAGAEWTHNGGGIFKPTVSEVVDGLAHQIVATRVFTGTGTRLDLYLDGDYDTDSPTTQGSNFSSAVVLGGHPNPRNTRDYLDGRMSHVSIYESTLTPARIQAHYEAGAAPWDQDRTDERLTRLLDIIDWPTDLRSLEVGISRLGPAIFNDGDRALGVFQAIEATEDGRLFISRDGKLTFHDRHYQFTATEATVSQMTFTDQIGADAAMAEFVFDEDDELVINAFRYSRRGGAEQRDEDDGTSIDEFGFREDTKTDLMVGTDNEVRARGQWAMTRWAYPLTRVKKLLVRAQGLTAGQQIDLLSLDLGQMVSVTRTPQDVGDPIEVDLIVEGINHTVRTGEWVVDLYVAPALTDALTPFTLGTSELDSTDVLVY